MKTQQTLSPEIDLVLSLSRTTLDPNLIARVKLLIGLRPNWETVFFISNLQGTSALIYKNINNLVFLKKTVPDSVYKKFRNYYYCSLNKNLRLWIEFIRIYDTFKNANIEIMPLKGIIFCWSIYRDPALRRIAADIDILVKLEDVKKSSDKLCEIGYAADKLLENEIVFNKGKFFVELHWYIMHLLNSINNAELWDRSVFYEIDERKIKTLSNENIILTLATQLHHHLQDLWLFRLCDINEILTQYKDSLDWSYILRKAKKYRIEGSLLVTLYLSNTLMSSYLPEGILKKLTLGSIRKKLLMVVLPNEVRLLLKKQLAARINVYKSAFLKILIQHSLTDCLKIVLYNLKTFRTIIGEH